MEGESTLEDSTVGNSATGGMPREGMPWGDTMGVINGGQCHSGKVP